MRLFENKRLLIIPVVLIIFGIIVIQDLLNPKESYMYIDDVSISVNDVLVFHDEIRDETASEKWKTIDFAHTTDEIYHSYPSSFALRCAEKRKGTLYPNITIDPGWAKLNVTWFVKIPEEAVLGSGTYQDLSLWFSERGQGRLRISCEIRLSDKSQIRAMIAYFGEEVPPYFYDAHEISFDFNNWNKVTLVLDKPSVLIYFDDVLVSDFPIITEYLAERIDIQWLSFYRLSIGGI